MPLGWAAAGAAVVGAAGSVIAGHEQEQGQEAAANSQRYMFDTIQQNEQPYMQGGAGAETLLSELLGTSPGTGKNGTAGTSGLPAGYLTEQFNPTQDQLNNYPGYQFALKTGGQAIRNADTPGVGALSGAALKDLMNFNVGTANQYYGQYFNQFQTQQNNIFNRLSNIASLGQNAAGNLGNNGAQLGTGIAQAQAAAAGSQAAATQGAFNSVGNGLQLSSLLSANGGGGSNSTSLGTAMGPGYTGTGNFFGD